MSGLSTNDYFNLRNFYNGLTISKCIDVCASEFERYQPSMPIGDIIKTKHLRNLKKFGLIVDEIVLHTVQGIYVSRLVNKVAKYSRSIAMHTPSNFLDQQLDKLAPIYREDKFLSKEWHECAADRRDVEFTFQHLKPITRRAKKACAG